MGNLFHKDIEYILKYCALKYRFGWILPDDSLGIEAGDQYLNLYCNYPEICIYSFDRKGLEYVLENFYQVMKCLCIN